MQGQARKGGLPLWGGIMLAVLVAALAGFALWLLSLNLRESASVDARRVSELAIAANNLDTWPESANQIGRSNLYQALANSERSVAEGDVKLWLHHPDFGEFSVIYSAPGSKDCEKTTVIDSDKMTVRGQALQSLTSLGRTSDDERRYLDRAWRAVGSKADPARSICYTVGPLNLGSIGLVEGFRYLLLAEAPGASSEQLAGVVQAQLGSRRLPIRNLGDLPRVSNELRAAALAKDALAASGVKTDTLKEVRVRDALQPVDSRVAGERLRFYSRPIDLASSRDGYILVGAVPAGGAPVFGDSAARLLAFGLAFALFVALVPVLKLALLGPVDTLKPVEVGAVVGGVLCAIALMTTGYLDARDTIVARQVADRRAADTAKRLVKAAQTDIEALLESPVLAALSEGFAARGDEMARCRGGRRCAEPYARPADREVFSSVEPRIDAVFLIDRNGRQPIDAALLSNSDQRGSDYRVADRDYFKRALAGRFAPGSERYVATLRSRAGRVWNYAQGGLVFDQIRSRADGVSKLTIGARLTQAVKIDGVSAAPPDRHAPAAIAISTLLPSLVSPALGDGMHYAIVDTAGERWPVLFHSDPGRAGVERFFDGLDPSVRRRLANMVRDPDRNCQAEPRPSNITVRYEGDAVRLALTPVTCTSWAVAAFIKQDAVERAASQAPAHGLLLWGFAAVVVLVVWFTATLALGDRAWCWLWPDPLKQERGAYKLACAGLAATALSAWLLARLGATPIWVALFCALAALASLAPLYLAHQRIQEEKLASGVDPGATPRALKLGAKTEFWFTALIVLALLDFAVIPVTALARDARGYFDRRAAGADQVAVIDADRERASTLARIDRTFRPWSAAAPPPPSPAKAVVECRNDEPLGATARLRVLAGLDSDARCGEPVRYGERIGWSTSNGATLLGLGLVLLIIAFLIVRTVGRGLFGFGVPLEAIDYPPLPRNWTDHTKLRALPPKFLVIGADVALQDELRRAAEPNGLVDLGTEIRAGLSAASPAGPEPHTARRRAADLILFENLELLLRDEDRRRQALTMMEQVVDDRRPEQRIGLLASLSPLDRLLQSYEREAEELGELEPKDRIELLRARAKHREDVRWSRLFERFHTFMYSARPRRGSPTAWLRDADPDTAAKPHLAGRLRTIWREIEYLPDSVLGPVVGTDLLSDDAVGRWAVGLATESPSSRAIVDFLSSMLIEHYHFQWSISSRAERLLQHRFAFGHIPNIGTAYMLRSLVRRGLVVLDPYPRIMNRSFAQYVRHVEQPNTLRRWRSNAESGLWRTLRTPLAFIIPIALGVLIVANLQTDGNLTSLLPLLVAAGPALLNALGSSRRTGAT